MPFKSQAQRRKFAELLVKGEISKETTHELMVADSEPADGYAAIRRNHIVGCLASAQW